MNACLKKICMVNCALKSGALIKERLYERNRNNKLKT
jgi:hypothetical protein